MQQKYAMGPERWAAATQSPPLSKLDAQDDLMVLKISLQPHAVYLSARIKWAPTISLLFISVKFKKAESACFVVIRAQIER